MTYPIRYIARFLVEAATPLAVGSGSYDLLTDAPVALDCNGLPMIPGSSLCGVLRHAILKQRDGEDKWQKNINEIFGYQTFKNDDGKGSRLVVSSALLVGREGEVIEGVAEIDAEDTFYKHYLNLPVRDHCKITERGVADSDSLAKFNNHVVYKGSRFVFELELAGNDDDKTIWGELVATIKSPIFRIGGGTRKGYGALKVVGIKKTSYDLKDPDELEKYLNHNSSLTGDKWNFKSEEVDDLEVPNGFTAYRLSLTPEDFFLFGAGFGDNEVNMKPVYEHILNWPKGCPHFNEEMMSLIPASSVKGAISHRTAYHYNRLTGVFADVGVDIDKNIGEKNNAVKVLFGCTKGVDENSGRQGAVIVSDLFLPATNDKILNHVAIDRFTQGPINGALFSERVLAGGKFTMDLLVDNSCLTDKNIRDAFEATLDDIRTGMLPLGGGVMRGHGVFTGTVEQKEEGEESWKLLFNN